MAVTSAKELDEINKIIFFIFSKTNLPDSTAEIIVLKLLSKRIKSAVSLATSEASPTTILILDF